MLVEPNEKQQAIEEEIRVAVKESLQNAGAEIDQSEKYPRFFIDSLAESGLLGLRYPEKYGGRGLGMTAFAMLCREAARYSVGAAICGAMQGLMGTDLIHQLGSEMQIQLHLVPSIRGKKIFTLAMTEPEAGSDLGSITTRAQSIDGGYAISGRKLWVACGDVADRFVVAAKTGEGDGLKDIDFFVIDRGTTGFKLGPRIPTHGAHGTRTIGVALEACRVTGDRLLGRPGSGITALPLLLDRIRVMMGAIGLGLAEAALYEATRYAKERIQFGKPISKFQSIRDRLISMNLDVESTRLLVFQAAEKLDEGTPATREATLCKLHSCEAANRVADGAARIHASYGYISGMPVERYLRDARLLLIGGGTPEVLKATLARTLDL